MKTKMAIFLVILLGLFTYSLPLYAGNTEYHLEEKTIIEIPIVGKISTQTTSYLAGCQLKESTTIKIHNTLLKAMSGVDGKTNEVELSDLCDEVRWRYDDETESYVKVSFSKIRVEKAEQLEEGGVQIDMESDQNDINHNPDISREIMGYEKNVNGFRARKVVTTVHGDEMENPIIIEEYYSTKAKALTKITNTREKISTLTGNDAKSIDGVPGFINSVYASVVDDEDWKRPKGEVIRFIIRAVDEDKDPVFTMTYDVMVAETDEFDAEHFTLK